MIRPLRQRHHRMVIVLGAIVLIRTVISYSLNAELKSEHQTKATPP